MMITTPAMRAHQRTLEQLRDRVRTVAARPAPDGKPSRPSADETRALHDRIVALDAQGYKRFEIAEMVGRSRSTISQHLNGNISTVAKATKPRR